MKPHHVEGAQRHLVKPSDNTAAMFAALEEALELDPEAEMEFVLTLEDPVCQECVSTNGACAFLLEGETSEAIERMDREVAREHGWVIGRRYRVAEIFAKIEEQHVGRKWFYTCADMPKRKREDGKDEYALWLADIRRSREL